MKMNLTPPHQDSSSNRRKGPDRVAHSSFARILDRSLGTFFWQSARFSIGRPTRAAEFVRTVRWQGAAAKRRTRLAETGVQVPPIIIFSITRNCNLQCAGCYARSLHGALGQAAVVDGCNPGLKGWPVSPTESELSSSRLESIVAEAEQLGVSFFVIAGGEPLMRPEILDIAARFRRVLFLLATNGTLLAEDTRSRLERLPNVVPLLSLEGSRLETDKRRGAGTYERLRDAMEDLRKSGVFFGCSITLTNQNFSMVLDDQFVHGLVKSGSRFFLYLEFTPTDPRTQSWVLTDTQREEMSFHLHALRKRHRALFVAVPWDELAVGGCLSAARGFVHINALGDLEPCPFAPYSDANLTHTTLLDALRSPFLATLRAMPELSEYSGDGCPLWKNREQVEHLLARVTSCQNGVEVASHMDDVTRQVRAHGS